MTLQLWPPVTCSRMRIIFFWDHSKHTFCIAGISAVLDCGSALVVRKGTAPESLSIAGRMEQETCEHLVDSIVSARLWLMDISTETMVNTLHRSRDLRVPCADLPIMLDKLMLSGGSFRQIADLMAAMLHRSVKLCSLLSLLCNERMSAQGMLNRKGCCGCREAHAGSTWPESWRQCMQTQRSSSSVRLLCWLPSQSMTGKS